MKSRFLLIILTIALFAANSYADTRTAVATAGARDNKYRDISNQLKMFGQVFNEVYSNYVDTLNAQELIRSGIEGMLDKLDPYTVYIKPEGTDDIRQLTTGEYGGIGIEIGQKGDTKELTVISPIDDTPASRKGLRSGDVISHINGESTAGWTTTDASNKIRGPQGTDVTLTVRRFGFDKPLEYVLTRELIRIHDVAFAGMIENDIAYIKLVRFSGQAGDELNSALKKLMLNKPKGLILDLRYNPGGLLGDAVQIAGEFLNPGDLVVSTRGRLPRSIQEYSVQGTPIASDRSLPVVVMINGGSASASEIVSGAIQDWDRGVLLGTTSFGKGLVQTVSNLPQESMLKITTARYYTPSGRCIQKDRKPGEEEAEEYDPDTGEPVVVNRDTSAVPDSIPRHHTRNGREVLGGGGVSPDVVLDLPNMKPAIVEMIRNDMFFPFLQDWVREFGTPTDYTIPPEMVTRFEAYLQKKNFTPPIIGSRQIDQLRQYARRDSSTAHIAALVDSLEARMIDHSRQINAELREDIRQNLERELASIIGGREARIRATFDEDTQISEAVNILRDKKRYNAYLTGTDQAKKK